MARCPNCGGDNFQYELRSAGTRSKMNYYRTGIRHSWILPAGQKSYRSHTKQKAVGICPDCGYIQDKQEKGCLFYVLCLIFFPITLSVWFYRSKAIKLDRKWKALIIVGFWVLLCVGMSAVDTTEQETTPTNVAECSEYAPLSDFDYYIDNDTITLKDYNGHSSTVKISSTYDVDGKSLHVVGLDGTFTLKSVDCVIVPDGVTAIVQNTFNSSGIKNLYLPSTLVDFTGWNYFHDVQKIYYGGTQEQWNTLYTGERSRLDVVQIIYDASPEDVVIN